jgi:hypothetical protein
MCNERAKQCELQEATGRYVNEKGWHLGGKKRVVREEGVGKEGKKGACFFGVHCQHEMESAATGDWCGNS